jgi:hypothetical protein
MTATFDESPRAAEAALWVTQRREARFEAKQPRSRDYTCRAALIEICGMVPSRCAPTREHVSRCFPAREMMEKNGASGGSRTPMGLRPADFLTHYGFRRPR